MGNLLFALVVGLSTPCTEPGEAAPPASQSAAVEKLLEERMPEDDYAFNGVLIPRTNALSGFRTSPLLDRGGSTSFSTPLPGRGVVPEGANLAAPVITPSINHGHLGYDVIPAGTVDSCDPIWTRHPEDFLLRHRYDAMPWRVWGSAEVLLGMTSGVFVPPLVTTGPTAEGLGAATLGAPGTVAIFGGKRMLDDWRAGLRSELGVWFDDAHVWGASARFYSLFSTSEQLVGGNGRTVIYIPHEGDEILGRTKYVYFPGAYLSGTISTTAQTNFAGGDISVRRLLGQGLGWQIYGLAGYRQLHLGDELGFGSRSSLLPFPAPLVLYESLDSSLRTRNNFYGAQIGGIASTSWNRWNLEGYAAVALGVNASDLNFDRTSQFILDPLFFSPPQQASVAERTNYFGTVWEGGLKLGYQVSDHVRLTMGYTALSWWNLRRAQQQLIFPVQGNLDVRTTGTTTNFYAHFFSWGAELRF